MIKQVFVFVLSFLIGGIGGGLLYAQKVLYIGDSITDGSWGRSTGRVEPSDKRNHKDLNHIYGHSYVYLCAAELQAKYPEKQIQVWNRGISGDMLPGMAKRWQTDMLDLHPDILSVLIGTNDINHYLRYQADTLANFDFKKWEETYRSLLQQARTQNPDLKIILGAPFVGSKSKQYERRKEMVKQLAEIVSRLAKEFNATYLPYDDMFAQLTQNEPYEGYWIWDGIHPTAAGHYKMAQMWLEKLYSIPR